MTGIICIRSMSIKNIVSQLELGEFLRKIYPENYGLQGGHRLILLQRGVLSRHNTCISPKTTLCFGSRSISHIVSL
jgi:hypothetical protein